MARPVKWRRVEFFPESRYFSPCAKAGCDLKNGVEEIQLKIEELEAMRLKDIENLTQEECAERMQVSRQTFQNIIDEARKKIAIALTQGKAISVGGGHYTRNVCSFRCLACGEEVEIIFEERQKTCKSCGSHKVVCNRKKCITTCEE